MIETNSLHVTHGAWMHIGAMATNNNPDVVPRIRCGPKDAVPRVRCRATDARRCNDRCGKSAIETANSNQCFLPLGHSRCSRTTQRSYPQLLSRRHAFTSATHHDDNCMCAFLFFSCFVCESFLALSFLSSAAHGKTDCSVPFTIRST